MQAEPPAPSRTDSLEERSARSPFTRTRPQPAQSIAGVAVALIVAAALVVGNRLEAPAPAGSSVGILLPVADAVGARGVGDVAPDFAWTRPNGETVALSSFRGRVVVINFWATWCVPCRVETPRLERTARAQPNVAFLSVNIGEDPSVVSPFLTTLEISHLEPIVDSAAVLPAHFTAARGVPTTYFIDSDGTIRFVCIGEMDDARLAAGLTAASHH